MTGIGANRMITPDPNPSERGPPVALNRETRSKHIGGPVRALLAMVALASITFAALATPALAGPTPDWQDDPPDDQMEHPAPTDNLAKLATAITVKSKSVTAAVMAPNRLGLTSRVDIEATFGTAFYRATYNNTYGNAMRHHFPDGQVRSENVAIRLVEYKMKSDGTIKTYTYAWNNTVRIEPLYKVRFGWLKFTLRSDCDWVGESNIGIWWGHSRAYQDDYPASLDPGESVTIPDFSADWPEVSVANSPRLAAAVFRDYDVEWPGTFYGQPGNSNATKPLVLPGPPSRMVRWTETDYAYGDCSGEFEYGISVALNTYPSL